MDAKFADSLRPGARVAVPMGAAVADLYGTPPIVTTATVLGAPGEEIPDGNPEFVWLGTDYSTNDIQLPQMYRVSEILGFLMPLATIERAENGVTYGHLPEGYVGP